MDEFGYDQEKVGKFIGKSRAHIANCLRLLSLPKDVIKLIELKNYTRSCKSFSGSGKCKSFS